MEDTTVRPPPPTSSSSPPPSPRPASASLASPFTLIPHIGKRLKVPLFFGPLFAARSVAVNNVHAWGVGSRTSPEQSVCPAITYPRRRSYSAQDVVHDVCSCMFRITLDSEGTLAALCYLPTRFQKMVEFYHTEIPVAYRNMGVGDLLVARGFQWAQDAQLLVIPSCPFVQRHLQRRGVEPCAVRCEAEGIQRLTAVVHDRKEEEETTMIK